MAIVNYLNLESVDDMRYLLEELEAMEPVTERFAAVVLYHQDVDRWVRRNRKSLDACHLGARFNEIGAELAVVMERPGAAESLYDKAINHLKWCERMSDDPQFYLRCCAAYSRLLNLGTDGQTLKSRQGLYHARQGLRLNPQWPRIPCLRALAQAWEDYLRWDTTRDVVWTAGANQRLLALRAYMARLEERDALCKLRDTYILDAQKFLAADEHAVWGKSMTLCRKALKLMEKYPKMPDRLLWTARARLCMARYYERRERLMETLGWDSPAQCRELVRENCLLAVDACLMQRRREDSAPVRQVLRESYLLLSDVVGQMPQIRMGFRKSLRYIQLALELEET